MALPPKAGPDLCARICRWLRQRQILAQSKFPAVLFVLGLVSFAPFVAHLGVYWDDWPSLWFLHFYGPTSFPQAFAIDRPMQGWLFVLTSSLLGEWMPGWHLLGILARGAAALALYWTLTLERPSWKPLAPWAAILFFIYPGFSQQYIPITYSHQFIIYAAYLASLGLMLRGFPLAALLIDLLSLLSLEYFFGLELLRPVLLWLADARLQTAGRSRSTFIQRLSPVVRSWLPYLLLDAAFLAWRLTHYTPRGQVSLFAHLAAAPWQTLLDLTRTIAGDVYQAGLAAWGQVFSALPLAAAKPSIALPYLSVTLATAALTALWFGWLRRAGQPPAAVAAAWIGLGAFALLAGGWPFWATGLRIEMAFPWDRFTLPMMVGASLLLGGALLLLQAGLERLARRRLPGWVLLALIVGLAAGAQVRYALAYRQDWLAQRQVLWQLAWRVPGLQPGALLITDHLPFAYVTDNSLTAPLNWMYDPHPQPADLAAHRMRYLMYDLNARLDEGLIRLELNQPVTQDYRLTRFEGSTAQAVVFSAQAGRCLKVIARPSDALLPNKPEALVPAYSLSQAGLIQANGPAAETLAGLAGPEPEHDWCYFFERAELAVQQQDWPQVVRLGQQAQVQQQKLSKDQAGELLPFILGYGFDGQTQTALALAQHMLRLQPKSAPALCAAWAELGAAAPAEWECK